MKTGAFFFTVFTFLFWISSLQAVDAQNAPQLQQPADGASGLPTEITFDWSGVSGADTYQIQVSDSRNFQTILAQENTPNTSITLSGFDRGERYFWRVRAGEVLLTIITYGNWSDTWSFNTTPPLPDAPGLVSPVNGETNVSTSPTLNWNHSENAETYRVQLSESESFSTVIEDLRNVSDSQVQISGLQNGTSYYWRVNAENQTGTGNWSETWAFTTAIHPPPAPNLLAPENGAEDVSTSVMLEWESVEEAEMYDFQIALDENFNNLIVNQQGVTSTYYNGSFEEYTVYFWRVRARNQGGDSEWSAVWNFTTEAGDNAIVIQAPSRNELLRGSENYTIRWNATNRVDQVNIEYSTLENQWTTIAEGVDASGSSYSWSVPDSSSIETMIRITDTQNSDIYAVSMPFLLYPSALQLQFSYSFNSARTTSDYKLIGIPANSGMPASEIFTGQPGQDWNLFHDNGEEENYLVPYDTSDVFTFRPGRGFWAISKPDVQISESTGTVELSPDTTYAIQLHQGWNIISNPFGRPIPWNSVQALNDITDPLWAFDGTFRESDILDTYSGYYVYNRNERQELHIPYYSTAPSEGAEQQKYRSITLNLIKNNEKMSFVEAGIQSGGAINSVVQYDPAPPGNFQKYRITIQNDSLNNGPSHHARMVYSGEFDAHAFDLKLISPSGEPVTLEIEGLEHFNFEEVLLVQARNSKTINLHNHSSIQINGSESGEQYQLIIGKADSVNDLQNRETNATSTLFQNHPNPFNNQTVIRYRVGNSLSDNRVVLEVFDIQGRRVSTLVNEHQPAGSYNIQWDASGLASGVYFYRLQIGPFVQTHKMTLLQ